MLEAGEDPLYVARRVVRMAVEDIGLADPQALALSMAAATLFDFIGLPEGNLALAQASSICLSRPSRMRSTLPMAALRKTWNRPQPIRCHCTYGMRLRD